MTCRIIKINNEKEWIIAQLIAFALGYSHLHVVSGKSHKNLIKYHVNIRYCKLYSNRDWHINNVITTTRNYSNFSEITGELTFLITIEEFCTLKPGDI